VSTTSLAHHFLLSPPQSLHATLNSLYRAKDGAGNITAVEERRAATLTRREGRIRPAKVAARFPSSIASKPGV
jgi:hypothetical protein